MDQIFGSVDELLSTTEVIFLLWQNLKWEKYQFEKNNNIYFAFNMEMFLPLGYSSYMFVSYFKKAER